MGFTALTLAAENISVFANPAVHVMQSDYSISAIGQTTSGKIDVSVTPAAGYSVYRSDIMPVLGRIPVYKSKVENNTEFTAFLLLYH